MPITGGMNNTKGIMLRGIHNGKKDIAAFDRLDVFIRELSLYYKQESNHILRRYNRDSLSWYLSLKGINNIYKYCEKVYLIDDKDFVDEIISSGNQPIVDRESALKYIELAERYWQFKKTKLKSRGIHINI